MAYEKHTWSNGEVITADKMNNIENGITESGFNMDLLWTNASPNSEFACQTINLDLSKYKNFIIVYLSSAGNNGSDTAQYYPSKGEYAFSWVYYSISHIMYRRINISDTGIHFTDCTFDASTINNDSMIPFKIYGVR